MANSVTENQKVQCDKGSAPTQIIVTSQNHVKLQAKLQATEEDYKPNENIMPFGSCKLKIFQSCKPQLDKWENTSIFTIDGKKELTTDSICMCKTGGKITIINNINTFEDNKG